MKKILLATTNQHKIDEYQAILKNYQIKIRLISLNDLGKMNDDVPETGASFVDNAVQKVNYYANKYKIPVISDDSGLEMFALNNFPGIHSKRWLEAKGFTFKINQLLKMVNTKSNDCQYVCAIAYAEKNKVQVFTSTVQGKLIKPILTNGFGFDGGFYLPQYQKTFGELDVMIKNQISHRAQAFKQFVLWFETTI